MMEKHSHFTIVMVRGGAFYKAKPIDAMIGSEVSFEPFDGNKKTFLLFPAKKVSAPVRLLSMACVLLLLVLPFYFIVSVNKTYAYVNIDINPSVELELNKDLKVQSIHSLNKDGKELVSNLSDYKNQNVEKVIRMIMKESEHSGMINDQKNILVGVSYANGEVKDISVLEQVDTSFQEKRTDWSVVTFNVPKHVREEAKNSNKSMNELMAGLVNKDQNKHVSMNDQERAIIHSFYTDDQDHSEKEAEESSLKIKEKVQKETIHDKETHTPSVSQKHQQMKQEDSNEKRASSNTSNKQKVEKEKYKHSEKKNNHAQNNNKHEVEKKKNNSNKKQEQNKDQKHKNNNSKHGKKYQNQSHHSYDKKHHQYKYNKNKHKDKQDDDDEDDDHDDEDNEDNEDNEEHDEHDHDRDD